MWGGDDVLPKTTKAAAATQEQNPGVLLQVEAVGFTETHAGSPGDKLARVGNSGWTLRERSLCLGSQTVTLLYSPLLTTWKGSAPCLGPTPIF